MFPGYKWLQFTPPPLKTDRVIEEFWNDLLAFFEDPLNCVLIFSSTLSSNDFCTNFKVLKFLLLFPSIKMDIATSNINSLVTYQRYFLGEVPQKSGRVCLLLNYQHHWIIILYVRSTRAVQLLLRLVWSGLVWSGLVSSGLVWSFLKKRSNTKRVQGKLGTILKKSCPSRHIFKESYHKRNRD